MWEGHYLPHKNEIVTMGTHCLQQLPRNPEIQPKRMVKVNASSIWNVTSANPSFLVHDTIYSLRSADLLRYQIHNQCENIVVGNHRKGTDKQIGFMTSASQNKASNQAL